MKTFQQYMLLSLALFLFLGVTLNAQTETSNTSTFLIIQKNNGEEKVVKNFDDLDNILIEFNVQDDEKEKIEDFMDARKKHTKPFLGVYSSENPNGNGIVLDGTVQNSAAKKAGLQGGDIITSINGNAINSVSALRMELKNHQVGDAINIAYTRNDSPAQVEVVLGRKQRNNHRMYSYNTQQEKVERDPCKVFLGVYSGTSYSSKGVKVTGIISGTPASETNLKRGDYISALDGIAVNSHQELLRERNKHNPGDRFLITYTRGGQEFDEVAYFKDCPKPTVADNPIVEEIVEGDLPVVEMPQITQPTNNTLKVEGMSAYPNPTYGDLKLNFQAEALPTNIRIVDIQGRVLFQETLNNFDGNYNRELNVGEGTPGVIAITITQGGKVFTKNIVLLARA
jgi:membrane-associated protease RseP (regulator of RpoE activity)